MEPPVGRSPAALSKKGTAIKRSLKALFVMAMFATATVVIPGAPLDAIEAVDTANGQNPRPFHSDGHNPITVAEIGNDLDAGANALEPDLMYIGSGATYSDGLGLVTTRATDNDTVPPEPGFSTDNHAIPPESGFSMVIMSDPQINWWRGGHDPDCDTDDCQEDMAVETNRDMAAAIEDITSIGAWPDTMSSGADEPITAPAGVIVNGDLTALWRAKVGLDEIETFEDLYGNVPQIYPGLGNHDYFDNVPPKGKCQGQPTSLGPIDVADDKTRCAKQAIAWMADAISDLAFVSRDDVPNFVAAENNSAYCFDLEVTYTTSTGSTKTVKDNDVCTDNWGTVLVEEGATDVTVEFDVLWSITTNPTKTIDFSKASAHCFSLTGSVNNETVTSRDCYDARALPSGGSGSLSYSFDINTYHFVQLHNYPGYEAELEAGGLAPNLDAHGFEVTTSYDWLKTDLAAATARGQRSVINMHDWAVHEGTEGSSRRSAFDAAILDQDVVAIFAGHLHNYAGEYRTINNGVRDIPVIHSGSAECRTLLYVDFQDAYMNVGVVDATDARGGTPPEFIQRSWCDERAHMVAWWEAIGTFDYHADRYFTDGYGNTREALKTYDTHLNRPPTVFDLEANAPFGVAVGREVTFFAYANDPDNDPLIYTWDFGDLSPIVSTEVGVAHHTYSVAGERTVLVSVSDPENEVGEREITFVVEPVLDAPRIVVDPANQGWDTADPDLRFGVVEIGTSSTMSINVENVGTAPLFIRARFSPCTVFDTSEFKVDYGPAWPLYGELAPGSSRQVRVTYTPEDAGVDRGCVLIESTDPDNPVVGFYVKGEGRVDATPPSVSITTPAEGAQYVQGEVVLAAYVCSDELDGSGIESCHGSDGDVVADGAPISTSTVGEKTFRVTGTDNAGNEAQVTHSFTVIDETAPTVTLNTPAEGASFTQGATVVATYSCADEAGPLVQDPGGLEDGGSGMASCVGDVASGAEVDTTTLGAHTFTVTGTDNAGNVNAVTHDYTVLGPEADISITKTDDVTTATPGLDVITYDIVIANAGPSTDPAVIVVDSFPAGLTGCSWTSVAADGATGSSAGSGDLAETILMPPGSSVTYTALCSIDPAASGTLSNTATATGSLTDPDLDNNTATDDDTVLEPEADISITKTDDVTTATPGLDVITYDIVIANAGPSTDPAVIVVDSFPAGLTGCSWTWIYANGGVLGTASPGPGNLADTLFMPPGSDILYRGTCDVEPGATGTLSNTATATASVTDPDLGNNSATDDDTVLEPEADISITKTDNVTTATPGLDVITYDIVVANAGPSTDPAVVVDDIFPAGLTGCSWTSVDVGGATGNSAGSGDLAETILMPPGSSVTYTATCNIDPGATGTLSNTATATASVTDPNLDNNTATDDDTVLEPEADISITKTDDVTTATPGLDVITYDIVIANAGPSTDPAVIVVDSFPAGLTGCSWTWIYANGGVLGTASPGPGNLADTLFMPPGSDILYRGTCDVEPGATGTLSNTATATASVTDPDLGNNSATDDDTVLEPEADISITKTDNVTTATPGLDVITYDIVVANAGPSTDPAVVVDDIFPDELTGCEWTSVDVGGATGNSAGSGNLAETISMPPGSSVTYTATCNIDPGASGTLSNTATATASVTDPNLDNNTATDNDTVLANVAPTASFSNDGPVNEGTSFTLSLTSPSDPSPADTAAGFEYRFDCGDGAGFGSWSTLDTQACSTADDGDRSVAGEIRDRHLDSTEYTATVTISNVAPTVEAGADQTTDEGTSVSLDPAGFTDPGTADTHTATIDWGDGSLLATGTVTQGTGSGTVDGSHTYATDGAYTVAVCVTDDDGAEGCDTLSVTANNVDPALSNVSGDTIDEDGTATVAGDITDPGSEHTLTLVIDWGEGAPETFTYAAGTTSFSEVHQYLDDNPTATPSDVYTIGLSLTDGDSGNDTEVTTVTVHNVAPTVSNVVTNEAGDAIGEDVGIALVGLELDMAVIFADVGTLDAHTVAIDWGDGTVNGGFTTSPLSDTHAYSTAGTYTVVVTVIDDDAGTVTVSETIEVVDAAGAVADVVEDLTEFASDPSQDPAATALVQDALDELNGNGEGRAASGALDMLERGNWNAALVKLSEAVVLLEQADQLTDVDLSIAVSQLVLTAKATVVDLVAAAQADATRPNHLRRIAEAQALIAEGDQLFADGDATAAVEAYRTALTKLPQGRP